MGLDVLTLTQSVLTAAIPIFGYAALGFGAGRSEKVPVSSLPHINTIVFKFCYPAAILRGLANSTLTRSSVAFILSYGSMSFLMFVVAVAMTVLARRKDGWGPAQLSSNWQGISWSTAVLIGTPVLAACYGDSVATIYPIYHMIFSASVNFCCYLVLFAIAEARQEQTLEDAAPSLFDAAKPVFDTPDVSAAHSEDREVADPLTPPHGSEDSDHVHVPVTLPALESSPPPAPAGAPSPSHKIARRVVVAVATNPAIWAVVAGLLFTLLKSDAEGTLPTVIDNFCKALAGCFSPMGLFSVGLFAAKQLGPAKQALESQAPSSEVPATEHLVESTEPAVVLPVPTSPLVAALPFSCVLVLLRTVAAPLLGAVPIRFLLQDYLTPLECQVSVVLLGMPLAVASSTMHVQFAHIKTPEQLARIPLAVVIGLVAMVPAQIAVSVITQDWLGWFVIED
jgi:predicted permease